MVIVWARVLRGFKTDLRCVIKVCPNISTWKILRELNFLCVLYIPKIRITVRENYPFNNNNMNETC